MGAEPAAFEIDGRRVRDLNGNGRLDPYEDPRRPVEERVDDLLAQMTLAEKAGLQRLAETTRLGIPVTISSDPRHSFDENAVVSGGKLPFELPSSMAAVRRQRSDVPCDSEQPLFPLGHGLSFETGS